MYSLEMLLFSALVAFILNSVVGSDLTFVCYPNTTVGVTNPDPGVYTHLFAVQDEGLSVASKCTVTADGSDFLIDNCALDKTINVFLSGRAASVDVDTFGSTGYKSYSIECVELASYGADRLVDNDLGLTLEVTTQDAITPSFGISMDFRPIWSMGMTVNHAIVSRMLYWTIDFPIEYYARPTCMAYSGTDDTGTPSMEIVTDGCSQEFTLVFADFYYYPSHWQLPGPHIKRLISTIFAFQFFNSEFIYFECVVKLCPAAANCVIDCDREKKRSIPEAGNKTETDVLEIRTGQVFRVGPETENSVAVPTGTIWLLMVASLALYCG